MDITGAGILIQDPKGKILVTLRKPFVPEGSKWGIPGGVNKPPDTPIQTAIKKTLQEVNLSFAESELELLDKFYYRAENNNVAFFVWAAKVSEEAPKINLNTNGHSSYMWKDPKILFQRKDLMVGMYPILKKYLEALTTPRP